ncbi:MAG: chemotaxis protein CheW, partial [Candidatus Saccharibacteria bacterium]
KGMFLVFTLGKEDYGIEIRYVTEIIGIQAITEVPELPEYVKGVINLRGKIIPVVDVRLRFKKESREYDDRTCIVVVDIQSVPIGLVVDRVSEVLHINDNEIAPPPELNKAFQKYIKGIGKVGSEVKLLLDAERLMDEDEIEKLTDISP